MRKQDLKAEITFFDRIINEEINYDTISDEVYEEIFYKIDPYLKGKLLEAGCGTGAFGKRVIKQVKSLRITGVDINQKMLSSARAKGIYRKLICTDLEIQKTFGEKSFDCILAPFLVHHFPDMTKLLENFYFWLKPGGFLIIIDPNGSNPILKITYLARQLLSKIFDLSNLFSPNEKNKSVSEFKNGLRGFEVVLLKTFLIRPRSSGNAKFSLLIRFALLQQALLGFYGTLPFFQYRGSGIIIVAKK